MTISVNGDENILVLMKINYLTERSIIVLLIGALEELAQGGADIHRKEDGQIGYTYAWKNDQVCGYNNKRRY
jgi:hypothetical protein